MSDSSEEVPAIVIDCGSGLFKAGFAGDDQPATTFSTLIHSPMHGDIQNIEHRKQETYVGKDISNNEGLLSGRYPIEHGIVTNWDDFELLMTHSFQELRTDPEEHGIVLSDPPLNPRAHRERILQLNFEAFNVPASYLANSAQLNLYCSGRNCGIVTDIGDGMMTTVPFYESHCISDGIQRQDFGGRDLTLYLQKLLLKRGLSFTTTSELQIVRKMKEALGYVLSDHDEEFSTPKTSLKKSFILPDGNTVTIDKERFLCPEALFNPSLAGFSFLRGLPDLISTSLSHCDIDVKKDICANFLVSGGCALFPGLSDRLQVEMKKRISHQLRVRVVLNRPISCATWIGGSILASLSTFQSWWISKQDYYEYGPSIVFRR